jgi:uncharacterized sporulation protein YeaH/YhbH (DUF444 family)/spore cortex formation protein SpoVR/YcgB (stage V sporulation)
MAQAAPHRHQHCQMVLTDPGAVGHARAGDIRITDSGQDGPMQPQLQEAARIIYHDIAPKLGLTVPQMRITSLSSSDMGALASNAGHPAPHWYDGAQVMGGAAEAAGILEFVVPGQPVHHQFVRDTNDFLDTVLVYAHVAGHYDMAENSPYFKIRSPDQIKYSYELSRLMSKLYQEHDNAEVSEFYHRLLTLQGMQDMSRGGFDPPEFFEPRELETKPVMRDAKGGLLPESAKVEYERPTHPRRPSESVLQAFVRNLPPTAPAWKREMADLFEKLHRAAPGYVQTKIMNEGWATMLEYIILAHSPWNSSADAVHFGQLNMGVRVPGLSNPYWLGSECWFRIRERHLEKLAKDPATRDLPQIEKDRLFVEEAHRIMRSHSDFTFIQEALDEPWVQKHNIVLYKTIADNGASKQVRAVTRDPKRVAQWVANKVANRDLNFAKIEIADFNDSESGAVLLKHKPVLGIPLLRETMSKALYVLARLHERPVTIDTIGSKIWFEERLGEWVDRPIWWGNANQTERVWQRKRPSPEDLVPFRMRVTATPKGEIRVEIPEQIDGLDREAIQKELQDELQKYASEFRADASLSYTEGRARAEVERFSPQLIQAIMDQSGLNKSAEVASRLMVHAPTAAEAVLEYTRLVKHRLERTLRLAAQGKWPLTFPPGTSTVQIRILPEVPEFRLDGDVAEGRENRLPQIVDMMAAANQQPEKLPDEELDGTQGPQQPGDEWVIPGQPRGKGKGKGKGKPQPGEPGEAGDGAGDPSVINITVEMWGKVLSEELELRNLRRTKGDSDMVEERRIGGIHKANGQILWDRTAMEIIGLGMAMAPREGKNPRKLTQRQLLDIGMKYYQPSDNVVADRSPEPEPDFDAVIVYARDSSGSMSEEHTRVVMQTIANESAILKSRYKKLVEVFVLCDTQAREVTREEFFGRSLGGGTDMSKALEFQRKILEERFPPSKYNRFAQLFSDGDDFNTAASRSEGEKLAEITEFFGYGHVEPWGDHRSPVARPNLSMEFENLSKAEPDKVGFAVLTKDPVSQLDALRKYWGKREGGK